MKKAFVMLLGLVLTLGLVAFAGPYFEIEQNPLVADASLIVGWDFDVAAVEYWPLRAVTGDFYFENDNLWAYPTPWTGGFDFGLEWSKLDFNLGMDVQLVPAYWPNYVVLDTWTTTFLFTGYPSDVFTVWVEAGFTYPGWLFTPLIGFSCHW